MSTYPPLTERQEQLASCLGNFWSEEAPEVIQACVEYRSYNEILELMNKALAPWKCLGCLQPRNERGSLQIDFEFDFETEDDRLFFILRWS